MGCTFLASDTVACSVVFYPRSISLKLADAVSSKSKRLQYSRVRSVVYEDIRLNKDVNDEGNLMLRELNPVG